MAVATKSENKSDFVREFLRKHPEGKVKAVNEAWTAAGMSGTIGDTLIYGTRADMGLSGKLRAKAKPKTAAKAKSSNMMATKASSPGKSMFVKEFLHDNPRANVDAVNKAKGAADIVFFVYTNSTDPRAAQKWQQFCAADRKSVV